MKRVIISETGKFDIPCEYQLDLTKTTVKDCIGCWSCWIRTPGRCIHKDLDAFYKAYINADKVTIFTKISQGFVSGNLKSLLDRMIPLYLPFISYESGESRHLLRYEKYPEVEVYYEGGFDTLEDQKIFEDYILRTFHHFQCKLKNIKPIDDFSKELI